jgi:Tol biopolymer transport system component
VASFEVFGEIGRGGMGVVYRGRDLKLERDVALKRPKREMLERPDFRKRFMAEARAASKLMHPNITAVFEVFEEDGVPWLVMELIDGASLRSLLSAGQPLPCSDVLRYAEGLTDALRVAHLGGVFHRDINPNNILIGSDGRARLSDFGLARVWQQLGGDPRASKVTTATGSSSGIAGTRGYMSPEQALGKPIDPRSDLFSLGAVLYEMCTGRPAFVHPETGEWLDALLHRDSQPISWVNQDVPIEFEEIVRRCLAKRRFQRYQSAHELLLDVRAVRRKLESKSDPSATALVRARRRRAAWGGLAGAVIAGSIGVVALRTASAPGTTTSPSDWNHRQLTAHLGWEGEPALSPNGDFVAYTSDRAGNLDIWMMHVSGADALQLTHDPGPDSSPAFFPDGGSLAFVSERDGARSIWQVPTLGGLPRLVMPNADDPAVSRDGSWIAFARPDSSGLSRIWVAPLVEPSQARRLTTDGHGTWDHMDPTWSPDGGTVCYSDWRDLWLASLDGGLPRRLTADDAVDSDPHWSADGRHIYFSSNREGDRALWRIHPDGGGLERLTSGTGREGHPSTANVWSRILYSVSDDTADIVLLDGHSGARFTIGGARDEQSPAVAPDGSAVVFQSDMRSRSDLWLQALADGRPTGAPRRLTDQPGTVILPAWSPDSRWIAYLRVFEGQRDIWIIPAEGGVPMKFTDNPAIDVHPAFSPCGSRLAFVSDREGREAIWVAQVADGRRVGEPTRITEADVAHLFPEWSPDGERIACIEASEYDSDVVVLDVASGGPPVRVTHGAEAQRARWSGDGEALLVAATWGTDRMELRTVSMRDLTVRPLEPPVVMGPRGSDAGMFGTSADDRLLAYVAIERRGDVWLAETAVREP